MPSKKIEWVGFCNECHKWRHTGMTLTNVVTKERRCAKCASRLLIKCKVCDGNGTTASGLCIGIATCHHCGGHKVVLQEPVHQPSAEDL